jgi:hypothetical protein
LALPDWILGVLFRPGETFERARTDMRFSYWWILLSVFTIETVLLLYGPEVQKMVPTPPADAVALYVLVVLSAVFMAQSICLFGLGRLFGWAITMAEAMKYSALIWSITLLEDMVTFYSYIKDQRLLLFWVGVPFIIWRLVAQTAGVRRLTGMPLGRAALLVFLATLPWQGWLTYQAWLATFH